MTALLPISSSRTRRTSVAASTVPATSRGSSGRPPSADYDGRWNFDANPPRAIIKTQDTESSAGKSLAEKKAVAAALRMVLKSVTLLAHTDATSLSSTTCAPRGTNSMPLLTACSRRGRPPGSAP